MASGIMIEVGPAKKKSLADDIASKIPPPGKLRKQKAMEGDDDEASAAAESAFEAFAEAVSAGDTKAGVKAFRVLQRLCEHGGEEMEDDEDEGEEY